MAGPSLSHILDDPRQTSGREFYSTPPSQGHRNAFRSHSALNSHHQRSDTAPVVGAAVSPNTRNHSTSTPVTLPPPTSNPSSSSSTLQVRPALATAPTSISQTPLPTAAPLTSSSSTYRATSPLPATAPAPAPSPSPGAASFAPTTSNRPNSHGNVASPGQPPAAGSASPGLNQGNSNNNNNNNANRPNNHDGKKMYACNFCFSSYSRLEHLKRHTDTHTHGRRFQCACGKAFARKDLLRRHELNHDVNNPSKKRRRTTTSPSAGRVSSACKACSAARVKCSDNKPCARCVQRNLQCVSNDGHSNAAMHLMHLSANAHSSAGSNENSNNTQNNQSQHHQQQNHVQDGDSPNKLAGGTTDSHSLETGSDPRSTAPQYHERTTSTHGTLPSLAKPPSYDLRLADYPPPPTELEPATSAMDPNRLPFSDFLRDVLYENSADSNRNGPIQGLTVLDFCDHGNLQLNDDDFALLDQWTMEGNPALGSHGSRSGRGTHGRGSSSDMAQVRQDLVKMWTNSTWSERNAVAAGNGSDSSPDIRDRMERVTAERLEHSARDRVLAMVLQTYSQHSTSHRIASSFPSVEVMDLLIQNFLSTMASQPSEWIHFPTFRLNAQTPEWIAVAAAAGAALSPVPTLRRFGHMLQDAARTALPTQFEDTRTTIRDVSLVQALLLIQEIGLWSGNRRKMELAQGHIGIPVTLMRYRSKFQGSSYPPLAVEPHDEGTELEAKWLRWIDFEQWKRLVFHCFLKDSQCSMTTMTNQSMSYAELTLPLPEPSQLWLARSPAEWKTEYLQRYAGQSRPVPSIGDLLHDIHQLPGNGQLVDIQFSVSVYLHGFWALILEYRRLSAVHRSRQHGSMGGNHNLLLGSRHQELVKELQSFQLLAQEWADMTAQEHMLLNLLLMNLHVSLDDLQLFAGKEGEEPARRVYPVLTMWSQTSEARSAVWSAGQVLRYAKAYPPGHLKDFSAVAVQHAALTLWAYGVTTKARRTAPPLPAQYQSEPVYLDGTEPLPIQRFVGFGQGRPSICGPKVRDTVAEASLEDPRACMGVAQEILRSNFKDESESLPPMVDNLVTLIKQLGDAAWAAGLVSN